VQQPSKVCKLLILNPKRSTTVTINIYKL
jgi:hypothetical protein